VGARIAWLAEQHVAAKRFLVATDARYRDLLSDVSKRTLEAQGGAMDEAEVQEFRSRPDWRRAVKLRLIDDRGKEPGLAVPEIDAYRPQLEAVIAARLRASG
jgi:predicted HD phosphohydrolase